MSAAPNHDPNFITGERGLIAVDKIANSILFLDPATYDTNLKLDGFAPRVHELGHLIAVMDLEQRRHTGDFSTAPYLAPHGLRWGSEGRLYCICENSGVLLEMDGTSHLPAAWRF